MIILLKKIYKSLPLREEQKYYLMKAFFTLFWFLVRKSDSYQNFKISEETIKELKQSIPKMQLGLKKNPIVFAKPLEYCLTTIIIRASKNIRNLHICLESIFLYTKSENIEIIVVNDSKEKTTENFLNKIKGIRIINNDNILGLVKSWNIGASLANGQYIVFLQEDDRVTDNWLTELKQAFFDNQDTGIICSKVVYPDGKLLTAGSLIKANGLIESYGFTDKHLKPQYCYMRQTDFPWDDCFMISKNLFLEVGGFNEEYQFIQFATADLALKIKHYTKKKIFYQPFSIVCRLVQMKNVIGYTEKLFLNREPFIKYWGDTLQSYFSSNNGNVNLNQNILVVDAFICLPDQDSGSLRMFNLLKILLSLKYNITFFPYNRQFPQPYVKNMQSLGIEILYPPYVGSLEQYLYEFGHKFNIVMLSRLDVAATYVDTVKRFCPKTLLIFDTVDLHFLREQREAQLTGDLSKLKDAEQRKKQELGIAEKSNITFVVSTIEKNIIKNENPNLKVEIVSNIHELHGNAKPFQERKDLLFIGGFLHKPNQDAVLYFVREIFPGVREKLHGIKAYIVGSHPPEEIKALESEDIIITGFVADVTPFFNNCRISIAPLRWGAGVKGKINQSMSYGVPVVATSLAVEGMFLRKDEDVLIADNPKCFADEIIKLYNDEDLWNKLSANSMENIVRYFSFEAAKKTVQKILA